MSCSTSWTTSTALSSSCPNPLLPWERRDGGVTTSLEEDSMNTLWRMAEPEAEAPAQGDVL
eukprot:3097387-Amphidinium_carterae.1